jgi:hypothetical protein
VFFATVDTGVSVAQQLWRLALLVNIVITTIFSGATTMEQIQAVPHKKLCLGTALCTRMQVEVPMKTWVRASLAQLDSTATTRVSQTSVWLVMNVMLATTVKVDKVQWHALEARIVINQVQNPSATALSAPQLTSVSQTVFHTLNALVATPVRRGLRYLSSAWAERIALQALSQQLTALQDITVATVLKFPSLVRLVFIVLIALLSLGCAHRIITVPTKLRIQHFAQKASIAQWMKTPS